MLISLHTPQHTLYCFLISSNNQEQFTTQLTLQIPVFVYYAEVEFIDGMSIVYQRGCDDCEVMLSLSSGIKHKFNRDSCCG